MRKINHDGEDEVGGDEDDTVIMISRIMVRLDDDKNEKDDNVGDEEDTK